LSRAVEFEKFSLPNHLLIILSSSANLFGNGFFVWKYFLKPYWQVSVGWPHWANEEPAQQQRFAAESDFGAAIIDAIADGLRSSGLPQVGCLPSVEDFLKRCRAIPFVSDSLEDGVNLQKQVEGIATLSIRALDI
jgi:hypothetical protein